MLLFGAGICFGQNQYKNEREVDAGIDVGIGVKGNAFSPSILYHEDIAILPGKIFRAGVGIRVWGLYNGAENLVSQNNAALRDTLSFNKISVNGASFVGGVSFKIRKVVVGANTDLLGLAFGNKRNAFYAKPDNAIGDGSAYYNKSVATSPTIINLAPILLRRATGQSEVFCRVSITKYIGLKLGYLYTRVTYITNRVEKEKVTLDNGQRHFATSYGMPYASLSFSLMN